MLALTTPVTTRNEKKRVIQRHDYFNIDKALEGPQSFEEAIFGVDESKVLRTDFGRKVVLDLSTAEKEYEALYFLASLHLRATKARHCRGQDRQAGDRRQRQTGFCF